MKKILVNLVTLTSEDILPPWLRIFRKFQSFDCEVYINTGLFVKKLGPIGDVYNFSWLSNEEKKKLDQSSVSTKLGFMTHSLKRNFINLYKSGSMVDKNFDVIYTPSAVLDFVIYPYCLKIKNKRIKWVVTLANTVPITDPGNKVIRFLAWIFFQISIFMIRKADRIFVPTPEIMAYLIERGFKKDKLVKTAFAIENDLIEKTVKSNDFKIDALFVGRINETKGIYDMLKIVKLLRNKYPDFQLAIMGDGDIKTKAQFKNKIKEERLENNVQFLGYRNGMEKYNIIKSAKCFWFLSVSESESFGIALLEGVCSGLPAFVYDLQSFKSIYCNGEVIFSEKGDYKEVARKVMELWEKGDFNNERGKLLLNKYSWEKIAQTEYNSFKDL